MHECVSERKWDKGAGHSLSRHFHVNKGLLHCTSARYPPFFVFFRKPSLYSFDTSLLLEWREAIPGPKYQAAGRTAFYQMSICLPDSWGTRLIQTLIFFFRFEELASFGTNVIPDDGPQILPDPTLPFFPYSQHAVCFCKVQETSLITLHMLNDIFFLCDTLWF